MRNFPFWAKLYLLALVLRLVPVLFSYNLPIGLDDMFQYDMLARSLVNGDGYRWYSQADLELVQRYLPQDFIKPEDYDPRGILTSFRPPGYPAFLALVYTVAGTGPTRFFWVRLVQAFIGAALAPLTCILARQIFPDSSKAARWAGLTLAIYPMLVLYPLGLGTENTFIPSLLAAVVALLWAAVDGDWRKVALAGVLFGLAMLTRSSVALVMPVAGLWLWRARGFRLALLLAIVVTLVVGPWAIRNTRLYGKLTFVETSLGYNLHMGYHPETTGTFKFGPSLELLPYLDDAARDAEGMRLAREFIREQPERFWPLAAMRLGHFFGLEKRILMYFYSNNFFGPIPLPALSGLFLLFTLPFVVLASLAGVGLAFTRWERGPVLAAGSAAAYILPHVFILAEDRFHLAIVPVLAVFAAHAWSQRATWRAAAQSRVRLAVAILLVGLLALNWGLELRRDADRLALLFGPEGNMARFDY